MSLISTITLCARVFCGFTLILCAVSTLDIYSGPLAHTWMNFDYVSIFAWFRLPLVLLLGIFGIWLMLGIRTRVIAFFSMILVTALILFDAGVPETVSALVAVGEFTHAAIFLLGLLVLTLRGGGATALVSRGWQGIL